MTVEIISVGTELLLGNVVNTDAAYLSEQCANLGLFCYYQSVVGDNRERLAENLRLAMSRSDVILLTGGLGLAEDDITKSVVAEVTGRVLTEDAHTRERIESYYKKKKKKPLENTKSLAMVPENSEVIDNQNGIDPGIILREEEKCIILLPGRPEELRPMFEESIKSYLSGLEPGNISSQTVKICGITESAAQETVKDLIDAQSNPTIALYAKTEGVHIRVTAKGENEKETKKLIKPVVKELKSRFGASIYSTDDKITLEQSVVDLLKENDLTLVTAESCTGGMIASRLINVPGVSDVIKEGFITYANKAKRKYLGVKKSSLLKYGAVSDTVAKEMAKGGCFYTKADACVAVTGIAGPDGGTPEKPVGLVYIACCVCGKTTVEEYLFSGERAQIREATTAAALTMLRDCLLAYFSEVTFGNREKNKK